MLIEYFKFGTKKWFKKLQKKKKKCIVLARDTFCRKNGIRFNSTVISMKKIVLFSYKRDRHDDDDKTQRGYRQYYASE